jgi:predicted nucleic acid-binding protein
VQIATVSEKVIDEAIQLRWKNFEDAIHHQAALHANCDVIVTRNEKDFVNAEIPILSPQTFLDRFEGGEMK